METVRALREELPMPTVPVVEGWFTTGDAPTLLGNRCRSCGTVFFPKAGLFCRNPDCDGTEFDEQPLARRGTIWSYTDAQYQPPPPYVPPAAEHTPFAIAAVELAEDGLVVLGQVAGGYGVADLRVGMPVELVVEELNSDAEHTYLVWKWRPVEEGAA